VFPAHGDTKPYVLWQEFYQGNKKHSQFRTGGKEKMLHFANPEWSETKMFLLKQTCTEGPTPIQSDTKP